MTIQQEADAILARPTVREICKAHQITTLDEQDALLARLWQDREALLAALKFAVAFDEQDASAYLDGNAWKNAMKQARAAIAQAEAHQ